MEAEGCGYLCDQESVKIQGGEMRWARMILPYVVVYATSG